MTKLAKYLFLAITLTFISCEDVIDLDLPAAAPRLVIEASLDWEKGTLGNEQTIKLSLSEPYFDADANTAVIGASVTVTNDTDGTVFVFIDQNNGLYTTDNFIPILNQSYTLEVIHNGDTYIAHETLMPVVDIQDVRQSLEGGDDDEALDVTIYFNDPIAETNFYLLKFKEQGDLFPALFDLKDEFTNGNQMSAYFEKFNDEESDEEEFVSGDVVAIQFYGISQQYYNYLHLLIAQVNSSGGPFGSTPVGLKGNCLNTSNPSKPAFGYFRLTQVVKTSYIFQ